MKNNYTSSPKRFGLSFWASAAVPVVLSTGALIGYLSEERAMERRYFPASTKPETHREAPAHGLENVVLGLVRKPARSSE